MIKRRLAEAKIIDRASAQPGGTTSGRFRGYSVERLLRFLAALSCEVEILVRSPGDDAKAERIHVQPSLASA